MKMRFEDAVAVSFVCSLQAAPFCYIYFLCLGRLAVFNCFVMQNRHTCIYGFRWDCVQRALTCFSVMSTAGLSSGPIVHRVMAMSTAG